LRLTLVGRAKKYHRTVQKYVCTVQYLDGLRHGMLSYIRKVYDHVRRNLVRDKDSSDVRQANFLTLDKPT
jgi:hypothetical protein